MQTTAISTKNHPKLEILGKRASEKVGRQRQAQLLNALLIMIGFANLALAFFSQVNNLLQPNWSTLLPILVGLLALIICYGLNRLGYTYLSSVLFFLGMDAIICLYIFTTRDESVSVDLRSVSTMLTVPVVAAGVIIGPLYSFLFAGIGIASVFAVLMARLKPGVLSYSSPLDALAELTVPICLLLAMAGLSWFFENNIRSLLARLTYQNESLDIANRELARKRENEKQLSKRVDELTSQLSYALATQTHTSSEQVAAVLRVSASIEQLNRTSEAISQAAAQVDRTAQQAFQVVEDGTVSVRSGLTSLALLSEQAQAVARAMDNLSQQASQIDQITELISDIAEETTLLSLNAKIEAAGAGEYGRRFGSVASEVQRLANRSRDASSQVREVVDEIRQAIKNSLVVSQRGIHEAAGVMSGTRLVEQTLEEIVHMVETTATLAGHISLATQEQRDSTREAVETMRQISDLSSGVTQGNQVLNSSIQHLNEAVAALNAVTIIDSKKVA
jgi:methyl-accepting chemotaxis protein